MTLDETLRTIKDTLVEEQRNGTWKPAPGDALHECHFLRAGFNSYGLEAADHTWRLTLSKLDLGGKTPSAILEVHAPGHDTAFKDLGDFVFNHSIGTTGGTNFNAAVKRLTDTLGGAKLDWERRITYLVARARDANAGGNNGTFSTMGVPAVAKAPPFVFEGRVRLGRTVSLFGPGSAGKTTIADGLIVSACSGVEIVPGWVPTDIFSCIILDWDEGREEEEVRLSAICRAYDVTLAGGYHYKRMSRPLYDVADEVGSYIASHNIGLTIISPVGRAARDHGDNLTGPIDELYAILRAFNTTNILIDHVTGASMKGGAEREFGSVRKRDNVRGSYSVYPDEHRVGIGVRVVEMRNTKPDALLPPVAPQAIRIEYDPPEGHEGQYDSIRFLPDEIIEGYVTDPGEGTLHERFYAAMKDGHHMTAEALADLTGRPSNLVRAILNRKKDWFNKLPSGRWENLPRDDV